MPSVAREEFKQYCLRTLGAPIIRINVHDDQIEDRIDDALYYYIEHHFDGTEKVYLKHTITTEDIQRRYIELPDYVLSVNGVVDGGAIFNNKDALFNPVYKFFLNEVWDLSSTSLIDYDMAMRNVNLFRQVLDKGMAVRFNRHKHRLELDIDWTEVWAGKPIMIECNRALDPEEFWDIYRDRWLREYATALIKLQWGQNMSKFENVQLPGGITMNGKEMKEEAKAEVEALRQEMRDSYEGLLGIYVGPSP